MIIRRNGSQVYLTRPIAGQRDRNRTRGTFPSWTGSAGEGVIPRDRVIHSFQDWGAGRTVRCPLLLRWSMARYFFSMKLMEPFDSRIPHSTSSREPICCCRISSAMSSWVIRSRLRL
jgi:hypothetical protein